MDAQTTTDLQTRDEIERLLLAHPSVEDCAVAVRLVDGSERMIVYVVSSAVLDDARLREHLQKESPALTVDAILAVASIPRGHDGGVDQVALTQIPHIDQMVVRSW